jgi:redox-sensitive bicupin YhaK (pirin superfamily)
MLEDRFAHKDSRGNPGKSGPGDVLWVIAGAGVIYYLEMPDKERIYSCGGLLYSCISVMG